MSVSNLELFKLKPSETTLPLFISNIQAGFPSPADSYLEAVISLDDICIQNPSSTILGRIKGDSLKDIAIYEGDIAVIDKVIYQLDRINMINGRDTLKSAQQGFNSSWKMKQNHLSPKYTTKLSDIIQIS